MAFDVAEAYKKKRKEEEEKKKTSSSTPFDVAKQYERYKYYETLNTDSVNDDYINTFMSDAKNFFGGAEDAYKGINWSNASSVYDSTNSTWQELKKRKDVLDAWLYKNKSRLTEASYKSLSESLNSIDSGATSIFDSFESAKNLYSQFKTEDDYNKWKADEDKKEAILTSEDFADKSKYQSTRNDTEEIKGGYVFGQKIAGSSAYDLYNDVEYEYINKNKDVIDRVNNSTTGSALVAGSSNIDTITKIAQGGDSSYEGKGLDFLTDEEIGIYNYYYHTQGKEKANEFLKSVAEGTPSSTPADKAPRSPE